MAVAAALRGWDSPGTSADGLKQYQELARAISVADEYLCPRDVTGSKASSKPVESPEVTAAFAIALQHGRGDQLYDAFINAVESRFSLVRTDMDRYMIILEGTSQLEDLAPGDQVMSELLDRLALWQRSWGVPLKAFNNPKLISSFTATFHQLVHSALPSSFPEFLRRFLVSSLSRLPGDLSHHKVAPPSPHLSRLGILPRYSGTLSRVAYEEIERIAREEADLGWEVRRLGKARQRVGQGVAGWLSGMFEGNPAAQNALRPMFSRFDFYLCKCFFDIRTAELFDIIVDYPDSMAALEDLKECLYKVDLRAELVEKLRASNVKRLLHPGAETKDVITQYISTIRCLRILDPPGVLLHKVAEPIRRHLRDRQDTIKCIVTFLVEGEGLGDENELSSSHGIIRQSNEDAAENFSDPKWEPEPVDAAPEFRSGKTGDVVSTLVSIYETREAIIKELQVLLATRLLAVDDYDAIRTIELLKIRFGEAALAVCDVMLKDVADSKRINDHVHGDIESIVQPLVISRMFWPSVPPTSLRLPPKLREANDQYEAAFHHFKPDKHLRFLQQLGRVELKLELEDRVVEVTATTLQAALIELFEAKPNVTEDQLREALDLDDEDAVRGALTFWANHGVVKQEGDIWRVLEKSEAVDPVHVVEEEPAIHDIQMDRVMEILAYWNVISSVLTTMGPQTHDDLHHRLSHTEGYRHDMAELDVFLCTMRERGVVDLRHDGKWVLLRNG